MSAGPRKLRWALQPRDAAARCRPAPGQSELHYRPFDYARLRSMMFASLEHMQVRPVPGRPLRPLAGANLDSHTNWMLALVESWATVGDIVSFYQERIFNEGYLGTAQEPMSVELLMAMLGVRRGSTAGQRPDAGARVTPAASPTPAAASVELVSRGPTLPSKLTPSGPSFGAPGASTAVVVDRAIDEDATGADTHGIRDASPYSFRIDPGAAALADVMFTVTPHKVAQGKALIPAGTSVRSLSVTGRPVVVFETSADLDARLEYNAIQAFAHSRPDAQTLRKDSVGLRLVGTATGLQAGDTILIVGRLEPTANVQASTHWLVRTLITVEPNPSLDITVVTWPSPDETDQAALGDASLQDLQVLRFERACEPFGADASPFASALLSTKVALSIAGGVAVWSPADTASERPSGWTRLLDGLPAQRLAALAVTADGSLWIAGAFGVARLGPSRTWLLQNSGLGSAEVVTLTVASDGSLWAGTSKGLVFRANDPSSGWSAVSGGYMLTPDKAHDGKLVPVKTALPQSPVLSLQPYAAGGSSTPSAVLVAGALGVFGSLLDGTGWRSDNQTLSALLGSVSSPYLSTALLDLAVFDSAISPSGAQPSGYAIAVAADQILPFPWYPLDTPFIPSALAPPLSAADVVAPGLEAPTGMPPFSQAVPLAGASRLCFGQFGSSQIMALSAAGPQCWVGENFKPVTEGLANPTEQLCLAAVPKSTQAGLPDQASAIISDGRVVALFDGAAEKWTAVDEFPAAPSDAARDERLEIAIQVAAGGAHTLLASAPLSFPSDWPNAQVVFARADGDCQIDLATKPLSLAPNSWVVLRAAQAARVFVLKRCETHYRAGATLADYAAGEGAYEAPARVARLIVSEPGAAVSASAVMFDPRDTTVFVRSSPLQAYTRVIGDVRPVQGRTLELAGIIAELERSADEAERPRLLGITGRRTRMCVTAVGGLWSQTAAPSELSRCWQSDGFDFCTLTALVEYAGTLWVGTENAGIFAETARGFEARNAGLAAEPPAIFALAAGREVLLALTSIQALVWQPDASAWSALPDIASPRALAVCQSGDRCYYWIGTASGQLWTSRDGHNFSLASNLGNVTGSRIQALAAMDDAVIIATDSGLYHYRDAAIPLEAGLPTVRVTSLAARGQTLLAGTAAHGVWVLPSVGASKWTSTLAFHAIQLVAADAERWYAATAGGGVFSCDDLSVGRWTSLRSGSADDIRALATHGGKVYAGAANVVSLLSPSHMPVATLVYAQTSLLLPEALVVQLGQQIVSAALLSAFKHENLELAKDTQVEILEAGRKWLLYSASDAAAAVYIVYRDMLQRIAVVAPKISPILVGVPVAVAPGSQLERMTLDVNGTRGSVVLSKQQYVLRPAHDDDEVSREVRAAQLVRCDYVLGATHVTLDSALTHVYERASLRVCANVVQATQGETVAHEILGNGDAAVANQSFSLFRAPLTFLPMPPPIYRQNTLTVKVANTLWRELDSLQFAGPNDCVYSVHVDATGRATLTFGDGVHGARLPSGTGNVVATYRVGLGRSGDVAAGTLNVIASPPPGVSAVTNPIPAVQGVDPASYESSRHTVPIAARTLNRVVTLADYAAFARGYPGVRAAIAQQLWVSGKPWILVSVAYSPNVSQTDIASRSRALTQAVAAAQAQPAPRASVASVRVAYFQLTVELRVAPDVVPRRVAALVLAALWAKWSQATAQIGEDVTPRAVEALIQAVDGVLGAQVIELELTTRTASGCRPLQAAPAHYDDRSDSSVPASLLALDPSESVAASSHAPLASGVEVIREGAATLLVSKPATRGARG